MKKVYKGVDGISAILYHNITGFQTVKLRRLEGFGEI